MLTADDIRALRSEGMSDDDILEGVRKHAPELAGDIDALKNEGVPSDFILNGISKHYKAPQKAKEGAEPSFLGELQAGTAEAIEGLGKTAQVFEKTRDFGKAVEQVGKTLRPSQKFRDGRERFSNPDEGDITVGGYSLNAIPYMIARGAPGMAADLAAAGVGGVVAGPGGALVAGGTSYAAREGGRNVEKVARNNNRTLETATTEDKLQAGAVTGAEAALNALGAKGALGKLATTTGQAAKEVGKSALKEGGTELGQELINQVGTGIGTEKGVKQNMNKDDLVASLVAGGAMGGAIRGAGAGRDIYQNSRMSSIGDAQGAALAETMRKQGIDPRNADEAFKLIQATETDLNNQIDTYHSALNERFYRDLEFSAPSAGTKLRSEVERIRDGLKKKATDLDEAIEALRSTQLAETDQGQRLISALDQKSALNKLRELGQEKNGQFVGGVARHLEWINPVNLFKQRAQTGMGGASVIAGIGGLGLASQLGISAATAGKTLAAPMAVYGAARALDKLTGNRNPAKEFMARKGAQEAPELPARPDYNWEQQREEIMRRDADRENSEFNARKRHEELLKTLKEKEDKKNAAAEAKRLKEANKVVNALSKLKARHDEKVAKEAEAAAVEPDVNWAELRRGVQAIKNRERIKAKAEADEAEALAQAQAEAEAANAEPEFDMGEIKRGIQAIQKREKMKAQAEQAEVVQDNLAMQNARKLVQAIQGRERMKAQAAKRELQDVKAGVQAINFREGLKAKEEGRVRREADAENANVDAQFAEVRKRMSAIQKVRKMQAKEEGRQVEEVKPKAEKAKEAPKAEAKTQAANENLRRVAHGDQEALQNPEDARLSQYAREAGTKQRMERRDKHFRAANEKLADQDGVINEQSARVVSEFKSQFVNNVKYQSEAREVVKRMLEKIQDPNDRKKMRDHFDSEDFYSIWKWENEDQKRKADEKRKGRSNK